MIEAIRWILGPAKMGHDGEVIREKILQYSDSYTWFDVPVFTPPPTEEKEPTE